MLPNATKCYQMLHYTTRRFFAIFSCFHQKKVPQAQNTLKQ
jgi:hypothetical protein